MQLKVLIKASNGWAAFSEILKRVARKTNLPPPESSGVICHVGCTIVDWLNVHSISSPSSRHQLRRMQSQTQNWGMDFESWRDWWAGVIISQNVHKKGAMESQKWCEPSPPPRSWNLLIQEEQKQELSLWSVLSIAQAMSSLHHLQAERLGVQSWMAWCSVMTSLPSVNQPGAAEQVSWGSLRQKSPGRGKGLLVLSLETGRRQTKWGEGGTDETDGRYVETWMRK